MLRYLTAGESHGPQLTAILEGVPAGLPIDAEYISRDLARRQGGYGRGGRMQIERDQAQICSGVRHGLTLGSPIALVITNRDWENWRQVMSPNPEPDCADRRAVTRPRPGHADLPGGIKYDQADLRNILERSSARETTSRVAVGAVCRRLLEEFQVKIFSHVVQIGEVRAETADPAALDFTERVEGSVVRCGDAETGQKMMCAIDQARESGDSLGGVVEVVALNVPVGLGSHVHWDRKLDGRLAAAVMSIQAIKGVEIGLGFALADRPGSQVHDEIFYDAQQQCFRHKTNNAGGIEGGISNGEAIVLRAAMKPIPTLRKPLSSADILTKQVSPAAFERSDVCAVPAAGVVAEAAVAYEIACAFVEKFGGDSLAELRRNFTAYMEQVKAY